MKGSAKRRKCLKITQHVRFDTGFFKKKQPHRHQEVLLQHPLHPQLNVEVSYKGRPRLLKWLFFFEGRRVHPLCPTLSWGARGREQLHKTVYVWVVVFFEEPGMFSKLWADWSAMTLVDSFDLYKHSPDFSWSKPISPPGHAWWRAEWKRSIDTIQVLTRSFFSGCKILRWRWPSKNVSNTKIYQNIPQKRKHG